CTAIIDTCDAWRAAWAAFWRDCTAVAEPNGPKMHVNPGKFPVGEEAPWVEPQVDDRTEHVPPLVQERLAVPPGPVQVVVPVATVSLVVVERRVQVTPPELGIGMVLKV